MKQGGFPAPDLLSVGVGAFRGRDGWKGEEGPRPQVLIGPGVVQIGWPDLARRERTAERAADRRRKDVDHLARYRAEYVDDPAAESPGREVTGWSRKSRANMYRTLAQLDYTPMLQLRLPTPMVTLTYPGDWEAVTPDGKAVKRHLDQFRKRFARAWGIPLVAIWKLEFQWRGAPHIHLWMPEPEGRAGELRRMTQARYRPAVGDGLPFRQWLSVVWADIVDHPDPEQYQRHLAAGTNVSRLEGARMTDPRRLAEYFVKHGQYRAKEYQHRVPELWQEPGKGPGRFWGYWGLEKAVQAVELEPDDAVWAGRILRRYARAQRPLRRVQVPRVDTRTGEVRYRSVRRRAPRFANGRGFLMANSGPSLAWDLGRALDEVRAQRE